MIYVGLKAYGVWDLSGLVGVWGLRGIAVVKRNFARKAPRV